MKMRTFMASFMLLLLCHLCRAQINSSNNDSSDETDLAGTQRPSIEGSEDDQVLQTDIWVELLALRDLVVEQIVKVAFSASLLESGEGNIEYGSEFATLIFRNVFTNTGNHYNPNTGYFTAPVRGVYYFRFTGHIAHYEKNMRMRLVKNSDAMVFIGDRQTTTTDPEDNASNGVVLQLEVGDVVSVQLSGSVWDDQYHRTTFSGFLLFPL
uniref:C1q domain-containing protein n=1 Tax=Pundamilia nyererei TaxID=303518 RepID=A0A3B4F8D4_9CICH